MDKKIVCIFTVATFLCAWVIPGSGQGPYNWLVRDKFDEIMDKMGKVNPFNCRSKSKQDLQLGSASLGQLPKFNFNTRIVNYPNRTKLLQMHNMALNRAFYYSYILQVLNNSKVDFEDLPGFQYYYFSASADVSANPGIINGSGIFFDTDKQYANWYTTLDFNKTIPLFGPIAWRTDDYDDNVNWNREPTNYTIRVDDYGAGANSNYTHPAHRNNLFVTDNDMQISFIPDRSNDNLGKHLYDTKIYYALRTGVMSQVPNKTRGFFGPPSPGQSETKILPVRYTQPYFDCGKSNKWIVSAVAPVIDYMARYSKEIRLRRPQIVAVATMEIDFLKIDFDPCQRTGSAAGSEVIDKTIFSGIARCSNTTICEPLPGYGFQRGGYMCHCKSGYRYPYWQNGPFMGSDIEQASSLEARSFDCIPVNWKIQKLTEGIIIPSKRRKRSLSESRELQYLFRLYNARNKQELKDKVAQHDQEDREKARELKYGPSGIFAWRHHLQRAGQASIGVVMSAASYVKKSLFTKNKDKPAWTARHPPPEVLQRLKDDKAAMDLAAQEPESAPKLVPRQKRDLGSWAPSTTESSPELNYLGRLYSFSHDQYLKVKSLMTNYSAVTSTNCKSKTPEELEFPGEVGYGAEVQFENEGRIALRLAHFLSAFYQNNNPDEIYGPLKGDKPLNREQLFGEVFANVMGAPYIRSSGIFFDRDAFFDRTEGIKQKLEYFAPYAFKKDSGGGESGNQFSASFQAHDAAGWDLNNAYFEKSWFKHLKERWASNSYGLERFIHKPYVRTNMSGEQVKTYEQFPMYYQAPRYEDLYWSRPYFDCNGMTERWVITASVPFFGKSAQKILQFLGVVAVSVPLERLDINQCPSNFYVPNFFKNSAPCDYESTYCVQTVWNKFKRSQYKCECRQGYEYPYTNDKVWFFAGGTVDEMYEKESMGIGNFYKRLKCREASAVSLTPIKALLFPILVIMNLMIS